MNDLLNSGAGETTPERVPTRKHSPSVAEELAEKYTADTRLWTLANADHMTVDKVAFRFEVIAAINEAIERCAEVAESGGVNVADPETAARIRALKVSR